MCSSESAISSLFNSQQTQVQTQIGIAVLSKRLDAQKSEGQAAVELLEAATEIAQQLGKGLEFDARA